MKNYARMEGGLVAELFETAGDITEMYHPSLVWKEITAAEHGALLAGQAAGKVMGSDASGRPVVQERIAPSFERLKAEALTEVRTLRAAMFATLAGLQSEALARGNAPDAMAIANVQQGCRDITLTDLSGCTTRAQIDAKFKIAWLTIVATAPASVRLAFAELKK